MDELELELKKGFLEEAAQLLDEAEKVFLSLSEKRGDPDTLNAMFRLAHNLKGTSRAVGFGEIAEFTHKMENLILKLKNGEMSPTDPVVTILLACIDRVRLMVTTLSENLSATFDNHALIQELEVVMAGGGAAPETPAPANEEVISADEVSLLAQAPEPGHITEIPMEAAPAVAVAEVPAPSPAPEAPAPVAHEVATTAAPAAATATTAAKVKLDENIRVSLSRIDKLNNLVGELVILQSMVRQATLHGNTNERNKSIVELSKIAKDLQSVSMSLRMIPIKATMQKMQRIVRDTSLALSKKVNLRLIGEDTELDKTVLENLNDPLVHIVRNAVDHGVETPAERAAAGKPELSEVTIRCSHEGNNLVIEISDDGRGIDPAKIQASAIKKGVLKPDAKLTDEQAINLVFHPGFSTKSEVSEISGRGVGMDVVKTNIEKMSGHVRIQSKVGKGSTFRVELPLTMAVIDGMTVAVEGGRYVLPLGQVHETLQPTKDSVHRITGLGEILVLRGEQIPVCRLATALGHRDHMRAPHELTAIIVRSQKGSLAVLVDEIFNNQQVVIKKMEASMNRRKLFMGSSILGDGMPSLIIDLHQLIEVMSPNKEALSA